MKVEISPADNAQHSVNTSSGKSLLAAWIENEWFRVALFLIRSIDENAKSKFSNHLFELQIWYPIECNRIIGEIKYST